MNQYNNIIRLSLLVRTILDFLLHSNLMLDNITFKYYRSRGFLNLISTPTSISQQFYD